MPGQFGNPEFYTIEYSTDGGKTYQLLDDSYNDEINLSSLNILASENNIKSAIFRTYKTGFDISSPNADLKMFYIGGTQIQFTSYYTVHEHKYMCVVKRGEFNKSLNPSLYDVSGSQLTTLQTMTNSGSIIKLDTSDENFTPYITTIGLYDDANQLVAYAKFANPIKITKDFDSVFIVKFDV